MATSRESASSVDMMSSPQLSREEVFAAAKARCIEELKKQVAHVESVTLEQYEHEKKKDF